MKKFLQHVASSGMRILNMKKVGFLKTVFFCDFFICLSRLQKTGPINFPEKQAMAKLKYLLPICQILPICIEGNAEQFTVSFAFCAHADVIKYPKTLMFSFERVQIIYLSFCPQCACNRKTIGSHLERKKPVAISL